MDEFELDEYDDEPIAVCFLEEECAKVSFAPGSIEEVANCILNLIQRNDYLADQPLFIECKKELESRAAEINDNYIEVSWEASNNSGGEFEPEADEETSWEFYYSKWD